MFFGGQTSVLLLWCQEAADVSLGADVSASVVVPWPTAVFMCIDPVLKTQNCRKRLDSVLSTFRSTTALLLLSLDRFD
jgi:hypothetical protein